MRISVKLKNPGKYDTIEINKEKIELVDKWVSVEYTLEIDSIVV